jgi:hypothetical protein
MEMVLRCNGFMPEITMIRLSMKTALALTASMCLGLGASQSVVANPLLSQSSGEFMGVVSPGAPAGAADEANYINYLNSMAAPSTASALSQTFTRSANTLCFNTCPDITFTGGQPNGLTKADGSFLGVDFGTGGFTGYVLTKYDADKGGDLVWYLNNVTGVYDLQQTYGNCGNPNDPAGCGMSHLSVFKTGGGGGPPQEIPEPSSIALVGLAMLGLGVARRRSAAA